MKEKSQIKALKYLFLPDINENEMRENGESFSEKRASQKCHRSQQQS